MCGEACAHDRACDGLCCKLLRIDGAILRRLLLRNNGAILYASCLLGLPKPHNDV